MVGSVEGLLGPSPRAERGGDHAAVVTCTSMPNSSNFISAAVFDIYPAATVLLIDFIPVHKIHVSPATTFTTEYNVSWLYGRCHATAALVRRLTTYYRTFVCHHNPGNTALPEYPLAGKVVFVVT